MHVWNISQNLSAFSNVIAVLTFSHEGHSPSLSLLNMYIQKKSQNLWTSSLLWPFEIKAGEIPSKLNHPSCPNCFWTVSIHITFVDFCGKRACALAGWLTGGSCKWCWTHPNAHQCALTMGCLTTCGMSSPVVCRRVSGALRRTARVGSPEALWEQTGCCWFRANGCNCCNPSGRTTTDVP